MQAFFVFLLCLVLAPQGLSVAQAEPSLLAQAASLEETRPEALSEALALYRRVYGNMQTSEARRVEAALGLARCLRRTGTVTEAKRVLDEAAQLAANSPTFLKAITRERERADQERPQENPVAAAVVAAVRDRRSKTAKTRITDLGLPALPTLRAILMGTIDIKGLPIESDGSPQSFVIECLLSLPYPECGTLLEEVFAARPFPDRAAAVTTIAAHVRKARDRRFDRCFEIASGDPDLPTRSAAAQALRDLPDVSTETWAALLSDPAPSVRVIAIESLTKSQGMIDSAFFAKAVDAAMNDARSEVRAELMQNIHSIRQRTPEVTLGLAQRAVADNDVGIQRAGIEAMRRYNLDGWRQILVDLLASKDAAVRERALSGLGRPESQEELARMAACLVDPEKSVRYRALSALRDERPARLVSDGRTSLFVRVLADPDPASRRFALYVLSVAGTAKEASHIVPFLAISEDNGTVLAFEYILRLNLTQYADDVAAALPQFTKSGSSATTGAGNYRSVGDSVVPWLIAAKGAAAVPPLMESLSSLDVNTVNSLALGIASSAPRESLGAVIAGLEAIDDPDRLANALPGFTGYLGKSPKALDLYGELLAHQGVKVRLFAASALGRYGDASFVPAMIQRLLIEEDKEVRRVLASAIVARANETHVDLLSQAWNDGQSEAVRSDLIRILSAIRSEEATAVLLKALEFSQTQREQILRAFRDNDVKAARPLITQLLDQGALNESELTVALSALGALGDAESIPLLVRILRESPQLRGEGMRLSSGDGQKSSQWIRVHPSLLAIRALGEQHAVDVIRALLAGDDSQELKAQAVAILAITNLPTADRLLIDVLENGPDALRVRAALAAAHALIPEATKALRGLLRSNESAVREAGEEALARFARFGVPIR